MIYSSNILAQHHREHFDISNEATVVLSLALHGWIKRDSPGWEVCLALCFHWNSITIDGSSVFHSNKTCCNSKRKRLRVCLIFCSFRAQRNKITAEEAKNNLHVSVFEENCTRESRSLLKSSGGVTRNTETCLLWQVPAVVPHGST